MNSSVRHHVHVVGQHFTTVPLLIDEEQRDEGPAKFIQLFIEHRTVAADPFIVSCGSIDDNLIVLACVHYV